MVLSETLGSDTAASIQKSNTRLLMKFIIFLSYLEAAQTCSLPGVSSCCSPDHKRAHGLQNKVSSA